MDIAKIITLLQNAGIKNIVPGDGFVEFDDPACIYTAFDNFLEIAWIVIVFLTAVMLFGWAILYIKNGIKIDTLFKNAKTVILIFCILSVTKPIINVIYGDDLFARGCDRKQVSLSVIEEFLETRKKTLSGTTEDELYETFDMVDSGPVYSDENQVLVDESELFESLALYGYDTGSFDGRANNMNYSNAAYTQDANGNPIRNSHSVSNQNANGASSQYNNVNMARNNGRGFIKVTYATNITIYINDKGEKIKRTGGSVAWRNNNPGNIRKSKNSYNLGAIGETDKWAVFPDEESGLNAIVKLLRSKNYKNLSVSDAINRWAPSSDGNNPESYAHKVSKMTGLSANAKIDNLNDTELRRVANAIKVIEGWKPGREEKL